MSMCMCNDVCMTQYENFLGDFYFKTGLKQLKKNFLLQQAADM